MDMAAGQLDQTLVRNIELAAHTSNTLVLAGARQYDRFLLPGNDTFRMLGLERLCHEGLQAAFTWRHEPASGGVDLLLGAGELTVTTTLPTKVVATGQAGAQPSSDTPLATWIREFRRVATTLREQRFIFFINAGMLLHEATASNEHDFSIISAIEHFSRSDVRNAFLILRISKSSELPQRLLGSASIKAVHIPAVSRDLRHSYAIQRGQRLAQACAADIAALGETVSTATEDWSLNQVENLLATAERQGATNLHDVMELARALSIGTTVSPWAGDRIRIAARNAETELSRSVMGQPAAVQSVAKALAQAVIGLSSAHQSQGSQAPRAVLFFAGPTGTGKTELAKALANLVFGQPTLLRFDCAELRQEHAVSRLVGAPPGFVGYERGGELTEGIRAKPNSVVLFDEIEKAHPRLLDTLMAVLDDGRLTSGQGDTAYFGQSILIFTSNLGMYEEQTEGMRTRLRARFPYETPFVEMETGIREAIREEFVSKLGRPELLGRFGGHESIIVFDYLRQHERIAEKFIRNVVAETQRLHGIQLQVDESIVKVIAERTRANPDALVLGGRGLVPRLKQVLIDPLTNYLMENPDTQGLLLVVREADETRFTRAARGKG